MRRCAGSRSLALITQFQLLGEAHGDGEGLRIEDLDVEAERRLETRGEDLDPLGLGEGAGAREKGLKAILVVDDGARACARHELAKGIGAQGWPVPGVEELGETPPGRCAAIALDLHEPHLGAVLQIVRGHPNLFLLGDPLLMEVGFTAVDEREGIRFAVILGESHLLETWWSIVVVLARAG